MDEEIEAFQYKDYYGKGTTLNYYPDLNGVKEEIILQEPSDRTEYEFLLKTTNAEAARKIRSIFLLPRFLCRNRNRQEREKRSIICQSTLIRIGWALTLRPILSQ